MKDSARVLKADEHTCQGTRGSVELVSSFRSLSQSIILVVSASATVTQNTSVGVRERGCIAHIERGGLG